jgi:hypothetical protein
MRIPVTFPYNSIVEFPDSCDIFIEIDKEKKNTIHLEYSEIVDDNTMGLGTIEGHGHLYLSYTDKSEMEIIYRLLMANLQMN